MPGAAAADEREHFAGFDGEIEVVEDARAARARERHVAKLDGRVGHVNS